MRGVERVSDIVVSVCVVFCDVGCGGGTREVKRETRSGEEENCTVGGRSGGCWFRGSEGDVDFLDLGDFDFWMSQV